MDKDKLGQEVRNTVNLLLECLQINKVKPSVALDSLLHLLATGSSCAGMTYKDFLKVINKYAELCEELFTMYK